MKIHKGCDGIKLRGSINVDIDTMVELRKRLRDSPLFNSCTKCPSVY